MIRRPPPYGESVQQMNGPAALSSSQVGLWRERIRHEQWAATRAHPFNPVRSDLGRDARLRMEITLALRSDQRLRVPEAPAVRKVGQPFGQRNVSAQQAPALAMLRGAQNSVSVQEAGSLTARQMQAMGTRFKNEASCWNPLAR